MISDVTSAGGFCGLFPTFQPGEKPAGITASTALAGLSLLLSLPVLHCTALHSSVGILVILKVWEMFGYFVVCYQMVVG